MQRLVRTSVWTRQALVRRLSAKTSSKTAVLERRNAINAIFQQIESDPDYRSLAKERAIDSHNWTSYLNEQRRALIKDPSLVLTSQTHLNLLQDLIQEVQADERTVTVRKAAQFVADRLFEKAESDLRYLITVNKTLSSSDNLRKPHLWFPLARMMKRKIIYHGGPTNSGKVLTLLQIHDEINRQISLFNTLHRRIMLSND